MRAARHALVAAIAGLPSAAGANRLARASQPGADAAVIEYVAAPGCVEAPRFRARLAALPRAGMQDVSPGRVAIEIVRTDGQRYAGTVRVVSADGDPFERRIEAATCDEVVDALELVSALALGLEPSGLSSAPAVPAPSSPPAARPVADRSPTGAEGETRSPKQSWHLGGGAHAAVITLLGPSPQPGIGAYLSVGAEGPSVWSPELRISALRLQSGTFETAVGSATLTLLTASVEGCPLRVPLGHDLALRPCGGLQLGSLEGVGAGTALSNVRPQSLGWSSLFGVARIGWTFLRYLLLEADVGLVVPLAIHHIYFGPDTTIYDVPAVGALATAGLGAHFP
jgi:hypothetical protein